MSYTTGTAFTLSSAGTYTTGTDFNLTGGPPPSSDDIYVEITSGRIDFQGQELTVQAPNDAIVDINPGTLSFVGSPLAIGAPGLLGADAYSVTIQGTVDLYYLSDDLHTFEVDYYPFHESDISKDLVQGALTVFGEINIENFAISAGRIDLSYLYDFYFRIHIDPAEVDLGIIVSAQTYEVNVWNAWFNDVTLNSTTPIDLPDTNLNFPYAIPYVFKPLENVTVELSIAEFGVPTIDGHFNFNFTSPYGTYELAIQGQRAVLWPYPPLVDYTEVRSWLTDVIPSKLSEQRYKVRDFPRLSLNYKYSFRGPQDFVSARTYANKIAQYSLALPYWVEATKVFNLTSGTNVIYIDTTYLELEADMLITLYVDYKTTEMKRITTVMADRLILSANLENSYTSCYLLPTYIGWANGIDFNEGENYTKTCNISFTSDKAYVDIGYYTPDTLYKSLPILVDPSVSTGGIQNLYSREQEIFDSNVGSFTKVDTEFYNRGKFAVRFSVTNAVDFFLLKRKVDYFQGKYKTFWLPSYHNDMEAVENMTLGDSTLKVVSNTWLAAVPTYVRIHGSSTQEFEIATVTDNLDGTTTIAFVETAAAAINNITKIETLTKVRFNSDNMEFSGPDKALRTITIPVIEIS